MWLFNFWLCYLHLNTTSERSGGMLCNSQGTKVAFLSWEEDVRHSLSIVLDIKVVKAPSLEVRNRFPDGNSILDMHNAYFIAVWIQSLATKCIFKLLNMTILSIWIMSYMIRLYDTVLNRNMNLNIQIQIVP